MIRGLFLCLLMGSLWGRSPDFLFYLQGIEESQALLPLLKRFEVTQKNYLILADHQATRFLIEQAIPLARTVSFQECGVKLGLAVPRDGSLTKKDIQNITHHLQPKVAVAGVDYRMQGQILEAYKKQKVMTVAYWNQDSCQDPIAERVARLSHLVCFPSKPLSLDPSFNDMGEDRKMVVGSLTSEDGVNTLFHALLFLIAE
jgi:hypothetical protein